MYDMANKMIESNGLASFSEMLEAARQYATCALAVVPIPRGEKRPRLSGWQKLATTDDARHRVWFPAGLPSNIGIATGAVSRVFVLDVDVKDDGLNTLAELERQHTELPGTPVQITPTGGKHILFALPEGVIIRNSVKKLGAGLDVRGEGGVIVAAPSVHPNGGEYRWAPGLTPWEVEPAEAPPWLLALILDTSKVGPKPSGRARPSVSGYVGEGSRNDTLFREASRLRGVGHDEEEVAALLQIFNRKNCSPPLEEEEVVAIAASAMRYSPNEWYELNDSGNALRFARDHAGSVRYVEDLGIWRTWTGTHWQDDAAGLAVMRRASETVERMKAEIETTTSAEVAKALRRHARASGDRARLRAMTDVAASLPGMSALSTDFDDMPGFIVASNGVIDLANGALLPHDPARLTTKCLPTAYQPGAEAPRFKAFLERVQPDAEVRRYLQRYLGQALHGQRAEQVMGWWHGRGRNGKSVLADTLLGLLPGYAVECPATTFLTDDKRAPNAPRPDLLRLQGARLVIGSEAADGRRLDSVLLKRLTGDATLTVRGLYKAETTFPITFNMVVLTNPWPRADESDDALWARNVRVPFPVQIPSAEQVKKLHELLLAEEARGILSWLVQGAVDYTSHGLATPRILTAATVTWRRRIGTIERFMRTCTRPVPSGEMGLTDLHIRYVKAVQQTYGNPVGIENFRSRLEGLGYVITDDEYGETVRGVQLAPITSVWAAEAMKKVAA